MARSIKHAKSAASTRTKVAAVTSIKLALSVLALGFSALAAAAASIPTVQRPDLVISSMQLDYTGYQYNNLPVVKASLVVRNIGTAPTPATRPYRILFRPSYTMRLICGFGAYNCQPGTYLPETKPGSGVFYMEVSAGYSQAPNSQRLVEFLLSAVNPDALKKFPATIEIQAAIDTDNYFPELSTANNRYELKFLTKQLVVKSFNPNDFMAGLCGGYGYGYDNFLGCYKIYKDPSACPVNYAYGWDGCYELYFGGSSECPVGFGYNPAIGCVKKQ